MRRKFLWLASVGLVCVGLAGCKGLKKQGHPHGICDCYQPDPCCTRSPWFIPPMPPPSTPAPPLEELPKTEGKKL